MWVAGGTPEKANKANNTTQKKQVSCVFTCFLIWDGETLQNRWETKVFNENLGFPLVLQCFH